MERGISMPFKLLWFMNPYTCSVFHTTSSPPSKSHLPPPSSSHKSSSPPNPHKNPNLSKVMKMKQWTDRDWHKFIGRVTLGSKTGYADFSERWVCFFRSAGVGDVTETDESKSRRSKKRRRRSEMDVGKLTEKITPLAKGVINLTDYNGRSDSLGV